jgi:hypothetical protein
MLPGFNTNIRHGGVLFHVQTEDSGRAHPHVITHLYHGGTILASEKQSYAELVDEPQLAQRVRELMEAQHRAMVTRLRAGELDEQIEQRLGAGVLAAGSTKGEGTTDRRARTGSERTEPAPLSGAEPTPPPMRAPSASASHPQARAQAGARQAGAPTAGAAASARPLDEQILDYLVDAARRRKRRAE